MYIMHSGYICFSNWQLFYQCKYKENDVAHTSWEMHSRCSCSQEVIQYKRSSHNAFGSRICGMYMFTIYLCVHGKHTDNAHNISSGLLIYSLWMCFMLYIIFKKLCVYMFEGISVCVLPFMQTDAQLTDIFY